MTDELKYNHGGLMRCCIETLKIAAVADALANVDKVHCLYCGSAMRKDDDGTWRWAGGIDSGG